MKLDKHKNLIILSAIILVLVLVNIVILVYPSLVSTVNPSANDLNNYKSFSTQIHYSVQALLEDSAGTLIDKYPFKYFFR